MFDANVEQVSGVAVPSILAFRPEEEGTSGCPHKAPSEGLQFGHNTIAIRERQRGVGGGRFVEDAGASHQACRRRASTRETGVCPVRRSSWRRQAERS